MAIRAAMSLISGARPSSAAKVVCVVVEVTEIAPSTLLARDRIGTAQQMIPGSCS